jgi:hypothetical protein
MSFVVTWIKTDISGRTDARAYGPYADFEAANRRRRKLLAIEADEHYMPYQRARVHVAPLDGSGVAS